ncbi:hypothetical protein F2P79_002565 [Pimephales promelas]|nr:hypothetical protein F2P79_002565 [Pimephales promelas]
MVDLEEKEHIGLNHIKYFTLTVALANLFREPATLSFTWIERLVLNVHSGSKPSFKKTEKKQFWDEESDEGEHERKRVSASERASELTELLSRRSCQMP